MSVSPTSHNLPDFPWDKLGNATATARNYHDSAIFLATGTPIDPVFESVQQALASVAAQPQYPTVVGVPELRTTVAAALWENYRMGTGEPFPAECILPVLGTKEFIASVVQDLGFGQQHTVAIPQLAYPTYEVSALLANAHYIRRDVDELVQDNEQVDLIFINSPANPTGNVLNLDQLRQIVAFARDCGAVIVSDECYLGLGWDVSPISILDPRVTDGDISGILCVHSLSKIANMASYRAGFVIGDPQLIAPLVLLRRHTGKIMPLTIQEASIAAYRDVINTALQKERYRQRRKIVFDALANAGFRIDHSAAGLYLWATRGENCWAEVDYFAQRGMVVAPGSFYGPSGEEHVRLALTISDLEAVAVAQRMQ